MADFETVTVETDLLICGGGMAACGAAVEASYWAKKNGLKITLVDKAAMDRSGAVAQGLYAINCYMGTRFGENNPEDHVRYARIDLMGMVREDLLFDAENKILWYKLSVGSGGLLAQCFECMRVCPIATQAPMASSTAAKT